MKEQITYLELLKLIRDGKAPLQIKYDDNIYKYESCQYGYLIRDLFKIWNDYGLTEQKCIEIISSEEDSEIEKIKINEYAEGFANIESIKINELIDKVKDCGINDDRE